MKAIELLNAAMEQAQQHANDYVSCKEPGLPNRGTKYERWFFQCKHYIKGMLAIAELTIPADVIEMYNTMLEEYANMVYEAA